MKVLTFSRHFPKGHPKAGEPTWFVEKIWNCFRRDDFSLPTSFIPWSDNYSLITKPDDYLKAIKIRDIKRHTIRAGNRFKVGDMASLRVWSGAAYRSKQVEFAQVEVKKVWAVEINIQQTSPVIAIGGSRLTYEAGKVLAANDGLSLTDFISWFNIHPKKSGAAFTGQIICWDDSIEYGQPASLTLKPTHQ